jgi:hypothetical protein
VLGGEQLGQVLPQRRDAVEADERRFARVRAALELEQALGVRRVAGGIQRAHVQPLLAPERRGEVVVVVRDRA